MDRSTCARCGVIFFRDLPVCSVCEDMMCEACARFTVHAGRKTCAACAGDHEAGASAVPGSGIAA